MNVREQACYGLWGYGSGYWAAYRDLEEAMARRQGVYLAVPSLCQVCPKSTDCLGETANRSTQGSIAGLISPRIGDNRIKANHDRGKADFASRRHDDAEVARVLAACRLIG